MSGQMRVGSEEIRCLDRSLWKRSYYRTER
jgi:hypothetical protein